MFLQGAELRRCNLNLANLRNANLTHAFLEEANLTKASLWGANLSNATLWGANLTDARLRRANLTDARAQKANLTNVNLTDANLTGADLNIANFTNAHLINANLTDAILWGDLSDEQRKKARAYYEQTSPEDFDSKTALKKLNAANFSHANLFGAYFSNRDFAPTKAVDGMFTKAQLEQMATKPEVLTHEDVKAWLNQPEGSDRL